MTIVPGSEDGARRLAAVRREIDVAASAAGRAPAEVRLLAVSKAQPADAIRGLYAQGQRDFGENYAQEMAAKAKALEDLPDLRLVFIGALQSNKIPLIVRTAAEIQSVGSERHARLVAKAARECGKASYPVYLLVNAGDEATKGGASMAEMPQLADLVTRELPELSLQGLMAIPPPLPDDVTLPPPLYRELRAAASRVGAGRLSLGMSSDLALAIAAGSDVVRVGTALFGPRPSR